MEPQLPLTHPYPHFHPQFNPQKDFTLQSQSQVQPQLLTKSSPGPEHTYHIRPATQHDLPHLPPIEVSAASLFTSFPSLAHLSTDEPMSVAEHQECMEKWTAWSRGGEHDGEALRGGTWVVVASFNSQRNDDEDGQAAGMYRRLGDQDQWENENIVAFIVTEPLPFIHLGQEQTTEQPEALYIHIDELSVHASHQRRGLAGRLMRTVQSFTAELARRGVVYHPSYDHNKDDDIKISGSSIIITTDDETRRSTISIPSSVPVPVLGLSLTTFRDVPFNAPFYAKFGFEVVDRGDVEGVMGREGARVWRGDVEMFEGWGMKRCWMVWRV